MYFSMYFIELMKEVLVRFQSYSFLYYFDTFLCRCYRLLFVTLFDSFFLFFGLMLKIFDICKLVFHGLFLTFGYDNDFMLNAFCVNCFSSDWFTVFSFR